MTISEVPDHPDFQILTNAAKIQNAKANESTKMEDDMGDIVDPESVLFAARLKTEQAQEALHKMKLDRGADFDLGKALTAFLMSGWVDGFMVGVRFQQMRAEQSEGN
ncbi:hypothetical protein PXH69_24400 [Rhodococcus qingshengii]|uniref:Uncharacterized protein n=1 Tax=Rhodococcus qingshengii TaxID=334542 RepID=A0AAW6LS76_RHOSG|nr:hypothetical protein [Rhodococcus qingshengii]MDE8648112.1 hypothetical protein [Rhodococcus qingshengii]